MRASIEPLSSRRADVEPIESRDGLPHASDVAEFLATRSPHLTPCHPVRTRCRRRSASVQQEGTRLNDTTLTATIEPAEYVAEAVAAVVRAGIPAKINQRFAGATRGVRFVLAVGQYLGSKLKHFELPSFPLIDQLEAIEGKSLTRRDVSETIREATRQPSGWLAILGNGTPPPGGTIPPILFGWFGDPWMDGTVANADGDGIEAVEVAFGDSENAYPWPHLSGVASLEERRLLAGVIAAQIASGRAVPLTQARASKLSGVPKPQVASVLAGWQRRGLVQLVRMAATGASVRGQRPQCVLVDLAHHAVSKHVAGTVPSPCVS